jgi:hypothetical protein
VDHWTSWSGDGYETGASYPLSSLREQSLYFLK